MSEAPPFWRFLPDVAAPDAATFGSAGAQGRGAFARALRAARRERGAQRTAALLRDAGGEAASGRTLTLLVASAFQPRALDDALRVAFAIVGLSVELRLVDGFAALGEMLAGSKAEDLEGVDMAFLPVLPGTAPAPVAELGSALAARIRAPVLVAAVGHDVSRETDGVAGLDFVSLATAGDPLDRRFERTFGTLPSGEAADRLADAAAAHAARMRGLAPKIVVTDLDGTLWSGTLGEDGPSALAVHRRYAETLRALAQSGFVLAIASRNDSRDLDGAFAANPDWPIARSDFAAAAIGWESKDALVAEVLREIGFGSEHMIFVDDDPVNCAKVAARFPDADVRLFAGDPDVFASALAQDPLLRGATGESGDRSEKYRRREAVERLRARSPDVGDFLRKLASRVTVIPLDAGLHPRAAELAARVNQFAMNGWRPSLPELAARRSPLDFMVRLDDAFGAHGLVGLVLMRGEADAAVFDGLFLSCRALGRGTEDAMLLAAGRMAMRHGFSHLRGSIEKLSRNEPAWKCFSKYLDGDGGRSWTIRLDAECLDTPEGMTLLWERPTT